MLQGLAIALLALFLLPGNSVVRGWSNRTLDWWFSVRSVLPREEEPVSRVAILAIDRDTRRRWNGRSFDARDVGRALQLLKRNGVLSVAVDVTDVDRAFLSPQDALAWQRDVAQTGIAHLPLGFYAVPSPVGETTQDKAGPSVASRDNSAASVAESSTRKRVSAGNAAGNVTDKTPSSLAPNKNLKPVVPVAQNAWPSVAANSVAANSVAANSHTALIVDGDAHVRRVPLVLQSGAQLLPALSLSTALQALQIAPTQLRLSDERGTPTGWNHARRLWLGERELAVEPGGSMLLNFVTAPSLSVFEAPGASFASSGSADSGFVGSSFAGSGDNDASADFTSQDDSGATNDDDDAAMRAPARDLNARDAGSDLNSGLSLPGSQPQPDVHAAEAPSFATVSLTRALRQPELLQSWRGRCVVIGATDGRVAQQWLLSSGARVPEAVIQAIAIDNLLSGNALEPVASAHLWLITILLCMTVGGLVAARTPLWSGLVTVLALTAVALLSLGLFVQNIWLDLSLPLIAATLTFLQGVVARARLQEREATRVSSTVDALERAGAIIAARGHSQELLERVLHWTLATMEAEAAIALIRIDEPDENGADAEAEPRFRVLESVQRKLHAMDALPVAARDEIAARVTRQSQPLLVQDAHRDLRFRHGRSYYTNLRSISSPGALRITSVLAAPLREGDPAAADPQSGVRTVGAILVINRRDGTPFQARDLELLTAVTHQASVALDNARLYDILNQRVARSESDLEKTNHRLEAEKNTLQTVLESMTNGVVVSDAQGRVQILNPAAHALLPELSGDVSGLLLAQCLPELRSALNTPTAHLASSNGSPHSNSFADEPQSALKTGLDSQSSTRFVKEQTDALSAPPDDDGRPSDSHPSDSHLAHASFDGPTAPSATAPSAFGSSAVANPGLDTAFSFAGSFAGLPLKSPLSTLYLRRGDEEAPRVIEVRAAPLLGVDQHSAGMVWVFSDVTEEKSIEQAKSDFVSFVAHEMRSPLTSISGFSSMLQRLETKLATKADDESSTRKAAATSSMVARDKDLATRQRFLSVIHNESERLTRLINNLLDVARIEAGRGLGLNCETLDFRAIADEAIESQRVYSSRHVLVNAVPADLPPLLADRDKVLQVLINLLSNAMKYSPGGNVSVAAHIEGRELVASVSDEGPGIAPEHLGRLFQRFGRISAREVSTKNPGAGERAKPTGTGLGLFLTRHLVESHNGRIWVESEAGQGARFLFALPLLNAPEIETEGESSTQLDVESCASNTFASNAPSSNAN